MTPVTRTRIARTRITGLVLAGGRGRRMGGADKGLVLYGGRPLIAHVLERLAPQVGSVLVSANRNAERYAAFEVRVIADSEGLEPYAGPLAGLRAGLAACTTPWLAVVPCDTPRLPHDLVARLASGIGTAPLAFATAGDRVHPLCCLLRASLAPALDAALTDGERRVGAWFDRIGAAAVPFADAAAFVNVNSEAELQAAS